MQVSQQVSHFVLELSECYHTMAVVHEPVYGQPFPICEPWTCCPEHQMILFGGIKLEGHRAVIAVEVDGECPPVCEFRKAAESHGDSIG